MPTPNATSNDYARQAQKPQRSYYMGTYPITKKDKVKLDLWLSSHIESLPEPSSNEAEEMGVIPSFPYKEVEIYGHTIDLPGAFHQRLCSQIQLTDVMISVEHS